MQPRPRENTESRQARFYCEHCLHEVPFNAEICPKCKRTFSGVRCPVCQFSGPPSQFQNGCPRCGYQATPTEFNRGTEVRVGKRGPASRRTVSVDWGLVVGLGLLALLVVSLLLFLQAR